MPIGTLASNATTLVLPTRIENIILTIQNAVGIISWVVGGLFGLYLIFIILKWREFRKMNDILEDIRHNLLQLNKKIGVEGASKESRLQEGTIWQRFKGNIKKAIRPFRRDR